MFACGPWRPGSCCSWRCCLSSRSFQQEAHPFFAWLRAFSEAAMVGALADWYAVTALFRHPLGLPIPHTAIIPGNTERIASNIGSLTQRKLVTPEGIARLVGSWHIPEELIEALLAPERRRALRDECAQTARSSAERVGRCRDAADASRDCHQDYSRCECRPPCRSDAGRLSREPPTGSPLERHPVCGARVRGRQQRRVGQDGG
jgi:hypothetical protein